VVFVDFTTVGKKVVYKSKKGRLEGVVKNEVFAEEKEGDQKFLCFIQCIEFESGNCGIRFCYYKEKKGYRRTDKGGQWIFTNRPLSIDPKTLKKLLDEASRKTWFRKLVKKTTTK
jgi:hypothetical protein